MNLVPVVVEQTARGERSYDIFLPGCSKNALFFSMGLSMITWLT